MHLSVSTHEVG